LDALRKIDYKVEGGRKGIWKGRKKEGRAWIDE